MKLICQFTWRFFVFSRFNILIFQKMRRREPFLRSSHAAMNTRIIRWHSAEFLKRAKQQTKLQKHTLRHLCRCAKTKISEINPKPIHAAWNKHRSFLCHFHSFNGTSKTAAGAPPKKLPVQLGSTYTFFVAAAICLSRPDLNT